MVKIHEKIDRNKILGEEIAGECFLENQFHSGILMTYPFVPNILQLGELTGVFKFPSSLIIIN